MRPLVYLPTLVFVALILLVAAHAQENPRETPETAESETGTAETESAKTAVAETAADSERVTALHDAAREGDLAKVEELLDAGVPVDAGNHYQTTALMYAAGWGRADVVRELLARGADLARADTIYGADAMTWAGNRGHTDVIVILVEHGADAERALLAALSSKNAAAVAALTATGKISQKLLDAARSRAHVEKATELAEVLAKAGAELPPPSTYRIAPELLARYAGSYAFEPQPEFKVDLRLEDGRLVAHFPGDDPAVLEALDDHRFRQLRSTYFELRFTVEDGVVRDMTLDQIDAARPFVFRREETKKPAEAATPGDDVAEAPSDGAPMAEAAAKTAEVKPKPVPAGAAGRDWPGFRGPGNAGTAQGSPPATWDVADGTNVRWKTPIPGRSHASPIVWGDKIFVATAVASREAAPFRTGLYGDPDFVDDGATYSWRLLALDRSTGEVLWQRVAHRGTPRAKHHIKATQMNATPVTDGRRVVAVMGSEGLFCYDFEGNLLWRRDLGTLSVGWFYDEGFEWGHSSSPILHDGKVILQVDRAREPFIAAYSLEDGEEVWRTARGNIPSWGTPALLPGPGGFEIVTNGSRKIRGYDAATGRELWHLGPHSEVTVGSVVVGHGLAFVVGNWSPIRAIYAIRPGGRGDLSLAEDKTSNEHVAWHLPRGGTYVPTPLVYGDVFYTLANNGILTAYQARTGERIYRARAAGRGGAAFSASPIAAAGRLYLASEDGDVYLVRHGPEFELLETIEMGEIIMATPAISGDLLLVRTLENLYAIGEAKKTPAAAD